MTKKKAIRSILYHFKLLDSSIREGIIQKMELLTFIEQISIVGDERYKLVFERIEERNLFYYLWERVKSESIIELHSFSDAFKMIAEPSCNIRSPFFKGANPFIINGVKA